MKISALVVFTLYRCWTTAAQTDASASNAWSYDSPISPLPRPAWLDRVVMFCVPYETPYEQGGTNALKPWARRLQNAGFTLMGMYPDGLCRIWQPEPGETWPQECRTEVHRMHSLGIKVLAGIYPTVGERGPRDLLVDHPDWRLRNTDATPDAPGMGCLVNPGFREALRDRLVQRIREFDIDGYQFDGWYQFGYCCCPGCRKLYRSETGRAVPAGSKNLIDPDYRDYLRWRDEKLEDSLIQLREAVKAVKPDFSLIIWNNNDCYGSSPSYMPEALNCIADWVNKEWWDSFDVESIWLNKRLRGASGGNRPPGIQPYMFMRWDKDIESGVYHGSSAPMTEVLYRAHEVMAMGSVPILWSGARKGWQPQDWDSTIDAMCDFLPWVQETQSLKYAVCIDSYASLQNARAVADKPLLAKPGPPEQILDGSNPGGVGGWGPELTPEKVLAGFPRAGMARALLEEHIPFDVISEHNVTAETLAEYKVVILPNQFCMSDRVAGLIRQYVFNGGGVVATYQTSLYDQRGKRRSDFALADVFNANYLSDAREGPSRIGFAPGSHPITTDAKLHDWMGAGGMTTYWGRFARIHPNGSAAMPLTGLSVRDEKDPGLAAWTPLVAANAGHGRCVYFPAAMDASYYDAGYPYERRLLVNAVRWSAGTLPQVKIDAPMCVLAGFFVRNEPQVHQTIVHLLNGIDSTTGHGSYREKQFAIREEIIPIHDIDVTFAGEKPSRVLLVPGKTPLKARKFDGGWRVTVPQLDLHAAVVAEYN